MSGSMVIAVDGPAASGKGTLAKRLAAYFDYAYLDTGSLYRAVGAKLLANRESPEDEQAAVRAAKSLLPGDLTSPELRTKAVGAAASEVAAIPAVRAALLDYQRQFAKNPPDGKSGAVLDGRDIGTVVCPDAPIKMFVTAQLVARASRRLKEFREAGMHDLTLQEVERDLYIRDQRDANRPTAPMKVADDAFQLDNTLLGIEECVEAALDFIDKKLANRLT